MLITNRQIDRELTDREKDIFRTIIHLYILTAAPVGSRLLSKYLEVDMKLSPATIRNVMADLEELELISHPHTSAGRVPTDMGYRYYVDTLMKTEKLSEMELKTVFDTITTSSTSENILKDASRVLGMLSRYLGIVELPHLSEQIVQKIELISLSSTRLLVVIALDSNSVRTVTLEARFELDSTNLDDISRNINERVSGKTLKFIRENFRNLVQDINNDDSLLIRLFIDSMDKLFDDKALGDRIHIAGTKNLLKYPEFEDISRFRSVVELIENEDIIIHVLDKFDTSNSDLQILIGSEINDELFDDYSLILSNYKFGSASGSIGLIGPKRMNYSKMSTLVKYVSDLISRG